MSLRVLIADDEQLSRERLKRFLRTEPGTELVAECANGAEALSAIQQKAPDLAFLDIRMPELDGFDVLKSLNGVRLPAIVFVTAYDQFALRAFEIDAVDYLLKPFNRHRFQAAVRRARQRLHAVATQQELAHPGDLAPDLAVTHDRIAVKTSGRILLIRTSEIDWISAADNYVELHLGNKVHLLRMTISAVTQRLGGELFSRISRSTLVNVNAIKEIHSRSHGDYFVVLNNGASLAGTRNYRGPLRKLVQLNRGD